MDYGFLGLSKAERRDRKRRRVARKLARYEKCVAKKGADASRCERIMSRAERLTAEADELQEKLVSKGKAVGVYSAGASPDVAAAKSKATGGLMVAALPPGTLFQASAPIDVSATYGGEEEPSGLGSIAVIAGGIALLGGGSYAIYRLLKKSKKAKKPEKLLAEM